MENNVIGVSWPRQEALSKITGEAVYIHDIRIPGCLEGKVLRSPYPHARILNLDPSRAKSLPGVAAVITGADIPYRLFGNGLADQPVLAGERVRFIGERVAAVAAADADTAVEALELIKVEYEELPAVTEPIAAMAPGAPILHPEQYTGARRNLEPDLPNVIACETYGLGNVESGFARADLLFEHTFTTQVVHQGYLEPHCSMAAIGNDGSVRVWSNIKSPFPLRDKLAQLLGLPASKIEVIFGSIGGDFGGKGAIMDEPVCYYLALAAGRPVRISMTAQEELIAANPRHAAIITIKSGVQRDGAIIARHARVIFDEGAYAQANSHPLVAGVRRALGVYRIPNTLLEGYAVYTNSVPGGHCRAPGDPQVFFAVESHTDMIAEALGMDPLVFRKRNVLREGDVSPTGLRWSGINAIQVLEMAAAQAGWGKQKKAPHVGAGIALTERKTGLGGSAAVINMHSDGTATVVTGAVDPGTGSNTVLRQIAATELGLMPDDVGIMGGSTAVAPYDNGSGSSRVTHITGQAVRLAARDVLHQAKRLAAAQFQIDEHMVGYQDGCFGAPGKESLSLAGVLAKAGRAKNVIVGRGSYVAEKSADTCFSAQAAEVEVDPETGHVTVLRLVAVNDIGRALNPLAVMSQAEGAAVQGMGFALNEELPHPGGKPLVNRLADYKMATSLDVPLVESYLLEGAPGPGPYGAKSIGEHGIAATAPAIANAVYDAVGVRIMDLPITPEKVLKALAEKKEQGRVS